MKKTLTLQKETLSRLQLGRAIGALRSDPTTTRNVPFASDNTQCYTLCAHSCAGSCDPECISANVC